MSDEVVLVTGAGGCIAAWVMKELDDLGARVIGFDLSESKRRARLAMGAEAVSRTVWEIGDIADGDRLRAVATRHRANAIIHLAALQVPFCKADPVAGAKVNVLGTVNVLETARHLGIKRLAYASSIAVQAMYPGSPWLATLYGAHKACGESMAKVYWQDWGVPSIGIRPGVVYGPGRDQGMSAAPTLAMLAAVTRTPYEMPFTGPFPFLYVREAASAFVRAVSQDRALAVALDLNGVASSIEDVLGIIRSHEPGAQITCRGAPFPFPADLPDAPLTDLLGPYRKWDIEAGIVETLDLFRSLVAEGQLGRADVG